MSTPPQGFASGPHTPPSSDRKMRRVQQQAAREQDRQQREHLRLQALGRRRRSISGPILLLTVGVLLLLLETGRLQWPALLLWLSLWWPAILIGTGIVMVLEWVLDNRFTGSSSSLPTRRILGGGPVFFLILLALTGAALGVVRRSGDFIRSALPLPWLGDRHAGWENLLGARRELKSELVAPIASAGELTVNNPHGDVTVIGSSPDDQVHVESHQQISTWNGDQPNRTALRVRPVFGGDRNHLTLSTTSESGENTDLIIQLPHTASLVLRSEHGDLSVEEIHGTTSVAAGTGDLKLTGLGGLVHVTVADDDSTITAHSLAKGLTIAGRGGDMDLSDIEGALTMHGDFFGTTRLERIHGSVSFQTSFTRFNCAGIPGDASIQGRTDLSATDLLGPVLLNTSDRNLSLDRVHGPINITDRNGSIELALTAPLQAVHVMNANGTVDVSLPEGQPFTLHAKTEDAEVQSAFLAAGTDAAPHAALEENVLGGGPQVVLESTNDDIHLHKLQSSDLQKLSLHSPGPG